MGPDMRVALGVNMRFLITGTAGFIGYHLAQRLLGEGHVVTGFDAMTDYYDVTLKERRTALLERAENFRFIKGRLEDFAAVEAAFAEAAPDVVIHLAAQAGVRYSIEAPETYIDSNLKGSWSILEMCRRQRPQHLMLASTSSVYGANEAIPFREADKADEPVSLYAATKKGMEAMAHSYAHLYGIPTTAFRFFTVYGPWGRPDMALFKFVRAMLQDTPIDVYGQGKMARDFTYIDDLVEGIVRLSEVPPVAGEPVEWAGLVDTLSPIGPYRVVNVGGGQPIALMDFISTIERCLGREAKLNMMDMQPGDVPQTYADPALLDALTGYVPQTDLAKGVAAFTQWYLEEYAPQGVSQKG
ncbi:NAD-dependent epimerase/dehydratase family protein [Novosphingobium sp. MBES04]|uniref:NAD-dependent epimerase/dehydratase family protein n=1 Tax=Novosphingobium sp. MBES04 TaxID=1206458 RepID=UPI0007231CB2|nr:NAD-dependent epimerase/dehydratase family protein [Novosphingobium sp. MBES04]GAM05372.1 Nucleoside-diphosphate-sugar epimerase [Novosphingobium sp. MBES04]